MSVGYVPKNELTANRALKAQELMVRGLDYALYSISSATFASVTDTVDSPNIVFTANTPGSVGNSISLVFNGSATVSTVVTAWNSAHPGNQVSFTGSGSVVPAANTYNLSGGGGSILIYIREPVQAVYIAELKIDASNTLYEYNQASIAIVDSKGGLSGYNEFGQQVSDQGAIQLTGISALNPNDVISVRYRAADHL